MNPSDVPIPRRMAHLPRDRRGYPIPEIVLRDSDGNVHFAANDEGKRTLYLMDGKCQTCGHQLLPERWFVGGPLSAFSEYGAYADLPMHRDCMHYAMKVCPYLAAPHYDGQIGPLTVAKMAANNPRFQAADRNSGRVSARPLVFVCVATTGQEVTFHGTSGLSPYSIVPHRPYRRVEFWQHGKQMREADAMAIIRPILADPTIQPRVPVSKIVPVRQNRA